MYLWETLRALHDSANDILPLTFLIIIVQLLIFFSSALLFLRMYAYNSDRPLDKLLTIRELAFITVILMWVFRRFTDFNSDLFIFFSYVLLLYPLAKISVILIKEYIVYIRYTKDSTDQRG